MLLGRQLGAPATITIDLDPTIEVGPVTLAWHGLTIALGVALGTAIAVRYARRRGLDPDPLFTAVLWLVLAGMAGARLVYLAENDAAALLKPGEWFGSRGFSFYGGMIFGTLAVAGLLWRRGLKVRYLDALAYGFPLGMALGRVGDLINGEHYGAPTDAPWGIRYIHPDADVPDPDIAYHAGGLYEIVLALLIAAVVYGLRGRLSRPGAMLWTVIGLYSSGRFVMFFFRVDSEPLALGLDTSQWISLLLVAVSLSGLFARRALPALRRLKGASLTLVLLMPLLALMSGCITGDDEAAQISDAPLPPGTVAPDPGPVHVHGLGINPSDNSLLIASHTGLYRALGARKARRIGNYQDTMAFEVIGPDRFLGSGHPDVRAGLPAYLGLIESRDGGRTWKPRSLQGKVDFHLIEVDGRRVYGYGSDFQTRANQLLTSADGGRTWARRRVPEPLIALALDPADSRHLVASGQKRLHVSRDGGKSWRRLAGASGLLAWSTSGRLFSVDGKGVVAVSAMGGKTWQATGTVSGLPAAFERGRGRQLLVALHDGTVKQSSNGGVTWRVRSRPR